MKYDVNTTTKMLKPYPAERLRKIVADRKADGLPVYDFGTGDPRIPLWKDLNHAISNSLPEVSQYPSIMGSSEVTQAQESHLQSRYQLSESQMSQVLTLPTRGSKEAIFHIALSLVEPSGRNQIYYPEPGYPVYRTSVLFASGVPCPYQLNSANGFLWEPWNISGIQVDKVAAIWVNYPHNPSGVSAPREYWQQLIDWTSKHGIVLLSDECYSDLYYDSDKKPSSPLEFRVEGVISFLSLSKRSGMTGHRVGYMAGCRNLLQKHAKARANFGLGQPNFMSSAAVLAWGDEDHVKERCKIFYERIKLAHRELSEVGYKLDFPDAGFYLWIEVPESFQGDDIRFCEHIANEGVIAFPSSWMGEKSRGYFRLSMVETLENTQTAMKILTKFV